MAVSVTAGITEPQAGDERERASARAHGVSVGDIETQLLLEGLVQHSGYDFRSYDPSTIKRRVERALAQENLATISELQGAALHDNACLERVLATLTARPLTMFGEPSLYRDLRATVVPLLRTYPFVRIWNVGCSTGQDAYALAIVLQEEGIYERCRIYATDAVQVLLDRARGGSFDPESAIEWQRNYASSGGGDRFAKYAQVTKEAVTIDPGLRRNIMFAQHNIVTDGSFNEFHLIFAPGFISQFNKELQARAHGIFYASSIRLGFLALGRDETIAASPQAQSYRRVETNAALYRALR